LPIIETETMLPSVSASSRAGSPHRPFVSIGLACWSLVLGCSEGSGEPASAMSGPLEGVDGSGGAPELAAELEPCAPAPGTTGSPSTIAETVDLVNGLPKPVSLACFLEALERPLRLVATRSFFSAQPAMGSRSPRIFLFMDGIIQSVVHEGSARNLLEMGEATSPGSSIKAELEFPITENITLATAFERLPLDDLTTCGVCHNGHVPVLGIDGAFESEVLRPADQELVPLAELEGEARNCDGELEPERCAMLGALFQHGEVIAAEFPRSIRTIFD
jgi:hypothetical protein